jgi:hypothetical protein
MCSAHASANLDNPVAEVVRDVVEEPEGTLALHYTSLHYTSLHCTALHCTALHCTAPEDTVGVHPSIGSLHAAVLMPHLAGQTIGFGLYSFSERNIF